jgi:hypothetical protein
MTAQQHAYKGWTLLPAVYLHALLRLLLALLVLLPLLLLLLLLHSQAG